MVCTEKKFDVPEEFSELACYLESLYFEVESRKSLLAFAMERGLRGNPNFEEYETEYKEFFIEYETVKKEFESKVIMTLLTDEEKADAFNWFLNFDEQTVTVMWKKCGHA